MLHQILCVTWKDLKILLKDTRGIAMLFLMPMMFILVMSTALQSTFGFGDSDEPSRLPVVNLDRGELAKEAIAQLDDLDGIEVETAWEGEPLTRERAEALVADGTLGAAIVFPADFSEQIEARIQDDGGTATVELVADPAVSAQFIAPIRGMVSGIVERVAETTVAEARIADGLQNALAQLPENIHLTPDQLIIGTSDTSIVALKQIAPSDMEVEVSPDTYQQNVPGYTVLGVFFIIGVMASSILEEKREGTFRRLLVAPLPKSILLAGKILPYYLVNMIQIAIMFGIAHFLFGMEFGDPVALAVVSLALAAAATGLGILVAALGRSDTQIGGLASLLTLTMSALGGCMVPSFVMPDFMQALSRLTPHGWAMQGFQDVLVRGYDLAGIVPETGVLLGFAAAFFLIGVWRFRFD
jgi:ABC-2 type transport system permease protein